MNFICHVKVVFVTPLNKGVPKTQVPLVPSWVGPYFGNGFILIMKHPIIFYMLSQSEHQKCISPFVKPK
jgi:hypothetical protein